ncbi:MAG: hypothetical protein L6R36_008247 [Xanthoria steineri]|nr:MAG: hypothetical protein L6R36_008247 [Xanthoria steineri]
MGQELIDTVPTLRSFLDGLEGLEGEPPTLYVDLEGNNLSRTGTLSLVTILVEPRKKVYLIDVTRLQHHAFETKSTDGRHLRDIFESPDIVKVFFDIRNDSDALFSLYGVRVQGVWDLQLFELASRGFSKRCVNGLAKCIERDSRIGHVEKQRWNRVKENGRKLFDPSQGGTYAVFDERPLSPEVEEYCTQDVTLMPHLCEIYRGKLCDAWWTKIKAETEARIRLSQSPRFNGNGRHMAEGPGGWTHWAPTATERLSRTFLSGPVRGVNPTVDRSVGERTAEGRTAALPAAEEVEKVDRLVPGRINPSDPFADDVVKRVDERRSGCADSDDEHAEDMVARFHGLTFGRLDSDDDFGGWNEDEDESRDFTACDSECGYCGKCMY